MSKELRKQIRKEWVSPFIMKKKYLSRKKVKTRGVVTVGKNKCQCTKSKRLMQMRRVIGMETNTKRGK